VIQANFIKRVGDPCIILHLLVKMQTRFQVCQYFYNLSLGQSRILCKQDGTKEQI